MNREDLKEIISSVIEKMKQDAPDAACGIFWQDNPIVTTEYAVGEEDSTSPNPTTKYAMGEEDSGTITTFYAVGEED